MPRAKPNPLTPLESSPRVREAARALIEAVTEEARERALSPAAMQKAFRDIARLRGRPLLFPMITGGTGRGARVRLADGTTLLDFIGGIGVN